MKRRTFLTVYYIGLFLGILLMNYMLLYQTEYTDSFWNSICALEQIQYVEDGELFLYIVLHRFKQVIIVGYLFFQISAVMTMALLDFYGAMMAGLVLCLCTFYQGIKGIFLGILLLSPTVFYILFLEMFGITVYQKRERIFRKEIVKKIIVLIILIIIGCFAEYSVNYNLLYRVFDNK